MCATKNELPSGIWTMELAGGDPSPCLEKAADCEPSAPHMRIRIFKNFGIRIFMDEPRIQIQPFRKKGIKIRRSNKNGSGSNFFNQSINQNIRIRIRNPELLETKNKQFLDRI